MPEHSDSHSAAARAFGRVNHTSRDLARAGGHEPYGNRTHEHRGNRKHDHRARVWPGRVDLRCIYGNDQDWENKTVIVPAVFKEWHLGPPPAFLFKQYPIYLYQRNNASKPCACANRGFESGVYFTFIAQHYAHLPAFVAFIQGDWIFETKTSAGRAFTFWQAKCIEQQPMEAPWRDYMPLGGRRSFWPPRCVIRSTARYGQFVGRSNVPLIEACARELLRVLNAPVPVRRYNRSRLLNLTFYTNMNLLVSRQRMRVYTHHAWQALAHRFVDDGVCLPATVAPRGTGGGADGMQRSTSMHLSAANSGRLLQSTTNASALEDGAIADDGDDGDAFHAEHMVDSRALAKWTLGMTTEFLQQTIFGFQPLENGPAPAVPADRTCSAPAATVCGYS